MCKRAGDGNGTTGDVFAVREWVWRDRGTEGRTRAGGIDTD